MGSSPKGLGILEQISASLDGLAPFQPMSAWFDGLHMPFNKLLAQ
jgi:hypothetical protein